MSQRQRGPCSWRFVLALVLSLGVGTLAVHLGLTPTASAALPHQDLAVRAFLPVGLAGGAFGPAPTAVTPTPTAPVTSTRPPEPTQPPTDTPTPTPTDTPTPSPTPTLDDSYREPLTDFPPLDDLRAGYSQARWYETLLAVLERRYKTGHYIVTELDDSRGKAAQWTSGRTGSFADLVEAMELTVHEMDHQLGIQEGFLPSFGQEYYYQIRDDKAMKVQVVDTFFRSEIAQYVTGPLENQYKSVYLTGQSGRQGFFTLLDEFNAYTHSLFTGYGVHDQYPGGRRVSHRDGLVTFMMYTQFYLRHGRLQHPADYAALRADPEVKALVALLWDRANFILDTTADIPGLALDPAAIEAEMRKPDMQAEIEMFLAP